MFHLLNLSVQYCLMSLTLNAFINLKSEEKFQFEETFYSAISAWSTNET